MRAALVLLLTSAVAHAAPPEPAGPHPRMLLDAPTKAAFRAMAKLERGPVVGAVNLCNEARTTDEHDHAVYMGSAWSRVLQACLVAWAATDKPEHAKTAIRFFDALLDDLDKIGDKQGGDKAAIRDSGYAIRNLGPYTALAYDWLHDKLTPAQRLKARERWAAWLDWYTEKGYRARVPGSNYQSGFLAAATLIAIAQGGEAAEENGPKRWAFVADELWGKDMAAALAAGGILDGGDWPEGWQYGPLAVAHYALAARIARSAGIEVKGIDAWLGAVLRRHVHGMSPGDRVYAAQDTEDEQPNLAPHVLTLDAVALGEASPEDRAWAKGELNRLGLVDKDFLLYDALAAAAPGKPAIPPRETWPTWYATPATATVFARTRWDARAVWLVAECNHALDVDHRQPKAGNFVLSRGKDDAIVDPSPYGSVSTLTSNAPTVASAHLPKDYIPSQGAWGEKVGWDWAQQTRSGIVALRCDYSDAYKFQERRSDVPDAIRDLVLVPSTPGTDAVLLVVDRASTEADTRPMNLRFRVAGGLSIDPKAGRAEKQVGSTKLAIATVAKSGGRGPAIGRTGLKDCFKDTGAKGRCDAARFDATDFRIEIPGPEPRAVHAIAVTDPALSATATAIGGDGWAGVQIGGVRDAAVVWPLALGAAFRYQAKPGTHVVLDAPASSGITAKRTGEACDVEVASGGSIDARPAVVSLDASCAVTVDAEGAVAASGPHRSAPPPAKTRSPRSGCCGAQAAPGSPIAMTLVVLALLRHRAWRRSRRRDRV